MSVNKNIYTSAGICGKFIHHTRRFGYIKGLICQEQSACILEYNENILVADFVLPHHQKAISCSSYIK